MNLLHLFRRAVSSLSNSPLSGHHIQRAELILNYHEFELWWKMQPRDQHHSILVLDRLLTIRPFAKKYEQAAALLHDVGKLKSNLGWLLRVVATIVGPRGTRFRAYHDHEKIGAAMLSGISEQNTIDLVGGYAESDSMIALRQADDL